MLSDLQMMKIFQHLMPVIEVNTEVGKYGLIQYVDSSSEIKINSLEMMIDRIIIS